MATLNVLLSDINIGWSGHAYAYGSATEFGYELPPYPDPVPSLINRTLNWRLSANSTNSWTLQKELLRNVGFVLSEDESEILSEKSFGDGNPPDEFGVTMERFARLSSHFNDSSVPVGDFRIWRDGEAESLNLHYYLPAEPGLWTLLSAAAVQGAALELLSFDHHFASVDDAPFPSVDAFLSRNQALFLKSVPVIRFLKHS